MKVKEELFWDGWSDVVFVFGLECFSSVVKVILIVEFFFLLFSIDLDVCILLIFW